MAAKAAAAAAANGHASTPGAGSTASRPGGEASSSADQLAPELDVDADTSTRAVHGSSAASVTSQNGHLDLGSQSPVEGTPSKSKKSKKKKKKKNADADTDVDHHQLAGPSSYRPQQQMSRSDDRFWNTNSQEERQRIKDFWLSLGEEERRNLVRLEKETILRKMKEQQRNTCSCAVCGRKRTAIEQELESLYESYYKELENYANRGDGAMASPTSLGLRPPRPSQAVAYHHPPQQQQNQHHASGHATSRMVEHVNEDDEDDESYAEDEYDEEYSDEEFSEDGGPHDTVEAEFLDFGRSLTVKGREAALHRGRQS
jgi:hypothetical protein